MVPYNAPQYRKEMVSQTDFRKYDGMLRMVLEQADVLEQERAAGRLVYGFHRSSSALMTCLVFDLTSAEPTCISLTAPMAGSPSPPVN